MAPDGPTPEELPHVLRDIQLEYTKEIGGLQVLYEDQWIDVPPVPGALVVNIGDMLQLITNDKFKSVEHRVLANTEGPRVSVASFFTTGTLTSLFLRILQCVFAAGSIASMVTAPNFFSITAFCYLIASMGLQIVWSFALAVLDGTALVKRKALHNSVLVSLFVIGDWHLPRQALPYCTSMTWEIVDLEKNAKNISCRSPWRSLVG
ncbi:hypothetical protein V6N12_061528 [Hibiscus sabdariffa]|uniref:CASP-like protein n=1 Tax=Hibiscus sabdariffa TaxID=183260 RepID=A0ABR2DXP5_9ROSI